MFLNIFGGAEDDPRLDALVAELGAAGFKGRKVLGPLYRKAARQKEENAYLGVKDVVLMHMPILPASTYSVQKLAIDKALVQIKADGGDADLILGRGQKTARFAHHSWRRLADTAAAAALARGEVTKDDVDLHFGWRLAEHTKDMQKRYTDPVRTARCRRAKMLKHI